MRKNILSILVFVITINISTYVYCTDIDQNFKKASTLYAKNRYKEAIGEYQQIINKGYESGNIYFNMGDCYFKLGDLAKAILYYERAKRLIPRDSDLKKNYEFAVSELGSQSPVNLTMTMSNWMDKLYGGFNVDELTLIVSVMYFFILFVIVLAIFRKRINFVISILMLIFLLYGIFGVVYIKNELADIGKELIVTDKSADVKYGPFDDATIYYQVYEGDKLKVLLTKDDWMKVKRIDNKSGWMKKGGFETI